MIHNQYMKLSYGSREILQSYMEIAPKGAKYAAGLLHRVKMPGCKVLIAELTNPNFMLVLKTS